VTDRETVAEVLDAAAAFIAEYGWLQGSYYRAGWGACAVGGIEQVTGEGTEYSVSWMDPAIKAMATYLADEYQATGSAESIVTYWNDAVCRDQQEAVVTLRKAAVAIREKVA
jgi:hypothetical protein